MHKLDAHIFDTFADREEFLGFGYIGGRRHLSAGHRAEADTEVLLVAAERGIDAEGLFEWANSKNGRWYADCWADGNRHGRASKYLPR